MAKRRKSKKSFKQAYPILYILILVVAAVVIYFIRPWEFIPSDAETTGARVVHSASGELEVHYIDVGQADSILVRVPDGNGYKNILIDAGTSASSTPADLISYLRSAGASDIEYLMLSHPHADHIGAADEVIAQLNVKEVLLPDCEPSMWGRVLEAMEDKDTALTTVEAGETYKVSGASFKILGPIDPSVLDDDKNNYSIITRMTYGDTSFLFTGDAESAGESQTLGKFNASELKSDVLKVGHHGANTSTSVAFLKAVDPDIAVISVGEGNSYGHPTEKIIGRLTDYIGEDNIFRTDMLGTVVLVSDGKLVSVLSSD